MKVRRCIPRVAGISYIAEYVARVDYVSWAECVVAIQVCVVMHLPAWPKDVDDISAQPVGSYAKHDSFGCTEHRRAAWRKDVDAPVRSASTSRRSPRVGDLFLSHSHHRDLDGGRRRRREQTCEEYRMSQDWEENKDRCACSDDNRDGSEAAAQSSESSSDGYLEARRCSPCVAQKTQSLGIPLTTIIFVQ